MESTSFRNLQNFETQNPHMEIFSNLSPTTVGKNLESSSKFGNNMNQSPPEDTQLNEQAFEMMKDFLPEIENELRKEIKAQLEKEYSSKYENFLVQTKENARQEIDAIIDDIKEESLKTYNEKMKILEEKEIEFISLKSDFQKQIELSTIEKLKQDFESEKEHLIKSLMEDLNSQKPTESSLTQKISDKLRIEYEQELKKELQKKERLLTLNMKKKLEAEKKLLQDNFELEWKVKLERDMKGVELERNEVGRLKSLENLRLKKLEEEKRGMNKEMAEIEKKYSTIINELTKENDELKGVLNRKENEEKIVKESTNSQNNNNNRNKNIEIYSNKKTQRKGEKEKEEEEFQNKYLKSMMVSAKKEDETKNDDFLEKNWVDLQKMINPLSSPIKLLHMLENKEGEAERKKVEVSETNFKKKEARKDIGKENRPKRISEYNSKQIAEDIIKLYASHKTLKNQQDLKAEAQTPSDPNPKANFNLNIGSNQNIDKQDVQLKNSINNKINNNFNNNSSTKVFVEENSIISNSEKSYKYEEYLKKSKRRKNEETENKSKRYDEIVKQCLNRYKKEGGKGMKTEKNEEFESIFSEKNSDNSKIKEMKALRKDIIIRLEKDYNLEEKCAAMQIYIQSDFLKIIKCPDISVYSQIQENIDILLKQWHLYDISYKERIDLISALENMSDNGAFLNKKLELEIEYLHGTFQSSLDLIEKLVERYKLKARINYEEFSFNVYRNLYNALKKMDEDIQNMIKSKKYENENNYFWRGADIRKMIACDFWEMDYVEKEEMKSEILSKIKKKLL